MSGKTEGAGSVRPWSVLPRRLVTGGINKCLLASATDSGLFCCSASKHEGQLADPLVKAVHFMQDADTLRVEGCEHPLFGSPCSPSFPGSGRNKLFCYFQVLGGGERHCAGPLRTATYVKNVERESQGGAAGAG